MRSLKTSTVILSALIPLIAASCGGGGGGSSPTPTPTAAPAPQLYVDPATGNDTQAGTSSAPLKTFKAAIGAVGTNGGAIFLYPGTYNAATGEDFAQAIPNGVSISGLGGGVIFQGVAPQVALSFASSGSASFIELDSFGVGASIAAGQVTLRGVTILKAGTGVDTQGTSDVILDNVTISESHGGIQGNDDSHVEMLGGGIYGVPGPCGSGAVISGNQNASFTLDGVAIENNYTTAIDLRSTSSATLHSAQIHNNGDHACGNSETLSLGETAHFTIVGSDISSIETGPLILDYATGSIDISGSTLSSPNECIEVSGTTLVARGNRFFCANGVYANTSVVPVLLDLGTSTDPGGNDFAGCTTSGVNITVNTPAMQVKASGDVWHPGIQTANSFGLYTVSSSMAGPVSGTNVTLGLATQSVLF